MSYTSLLRRRAFATRPCLARSSARSRPGELRGRRRRVPPPARRACRRRDCSGRSRNNPRAAAFACPSAGRQDCRAVGPVPAAVAAEVRACVVCAVSARKVSRIRQRHQPDAKASVNGAVKSSENLLRGRFARRRSLRPPPSSNTPTMPNLDPKGLRYMSKDSSAPTAVEMGMKNHELRAAPLISRSAGSSVAARSSCEAAVQNKLVAHDSKPYDGYRLTGKGWRLPRSALSPRLDRGGRHPDRRRQGVGHLHGERRGRQRAVPQLHRLCCSFRTIKQNRDYLKPGQAASWLYMSRLSALKEYAFMKALHEKGFPVPTPIDVDRHCVVMSLAPGYQLNSIQVLRHPSSVFDNLMRLACRLASCGLIHATHGYHDGRRRGERHAHRLRRWCRPTTRTPAGTSIATSSACASSSRGGLGSRRRRCQARDGRRAERRRRRPRRRAVGEWVSAAQASELERVRQATGYDATGEGGDEEGGEEEGRGSEERARRSRRRRRLGRCQLEGNPTPGRRPGGRGGRGGDGRGGRGRRRVSALAPASAGAAAADDDDDAEGERAAASAAVLLEAMALARAPAGVADAGRSERRRRRRRRRRRVGGAAVAGGRRARTAASVTVRSSTGRLVDVDVTRACGGTCREGGSAPGRGRATAQGPREAEARVERQGVELRRRVGLDAQFFDYLQ